MKNNSSFCHFWVSSQNGSERGAANSAMMMMMMMELPFFRRPLLRYIHVYGHFFSLGLGSLVS
jgi:hypothetical protein